MHQATCWSISSRVPHLHTALTLCQVDEAQKALQFVSISSDGNVNLWTMNKSELTHEPLMKLKVVRQAGRGEPLPGEENGTSVVMSIAGGCCMDFCKVRRAADRAGWRHLAVGCYRTAHLKQGRDLVQSSKVVNVKHVKHE